METQIQNLLSALHPVRRAATLKKIGRLIKKRNSQRIAQNIAPEGEKWEARKAQKKRGKMVVRKKKMLKSFRLARHLKIKHGGSGITVGFYGKMEEYGALHQFGGTAIVKGGMTAEYPARPLLGLSDDDLADIYDLVLDSFN